MNGDPVFVQKNAALAQEVIRKAAELNRQLLLRRTGSSTPPVAQVPFCYYCDQEFADETTLVHHQQSAHWWCTLCPIHTNTLHQLRQHCSSIHRRTLQVVPNAMPTRNDSRVNINGMQGVHPQIIQEHNAIKASQPKPPPTPYSIPSGCSVSTSSTCTSSTSGPTSLPVPAKESLPVRPSSDFDSGSKEAVRVKLFVGGHIHRVVLKSAKFEHLLELLCLRLAPHTEFLVRYEDDDKDVILVTATHDLVEAMAVQKITPGSSDTLKLIVTPVEQVSQGMTTALHNPSQIADYAHTATAANALNLHLAHPTNSSSHHPDLTRSNSYAIAQNPYLKDFEAYTPPCDIPTEHWTSQNDVRGISQLASATSLQDIRDIRDVREEEASIDVRELPLEHVSPAMSEFLGDAMRVIQSHHGSNLDFLRQVAESVIEHADEKTHRLLTRSAVSSIREYSGILELLLDAGWIYDDLTHQAEFPKGGDLSRMRTLLRLLPARQQEPVLRQRERSASQSKKSRDRSRQSPRRSRGKSRDRKRSRDQSPEPKATLEQERERQQQKMRERIGGVNKPRRRSPFVRRG